MIEKIVSGGQTGVDQGGLEAAKELGISTGGWAPKGFLTELGDFPLLGEKYNLVEHTSRNYVPRTYTNVRDSDGTLILSSNWQSKGTICTQKAIKQYDKPFCEISVTNGCLVDMENDIQTMKDWIEENDIKILNVAGNRESVCPGIQALTKEFLISVFKDTFC